MGTTNPLRGNSSMCPALGPLWGTSIFRTPCAPYLQILATPLTTININVFVFCRTEQKMCSFQVAVLLLLVGVVISSKPPGEIIAAAAQLLSFSFTDYSWHHAVIPRIQDDTIKNCTSAFLCLQYDIQFWLFKNFAHIKERNLRKTLCLIANWNMRNVAVFIASPCILCYVITMI